jgi:hypothetical protein
MTSQAEQKQPVESATAAADPEGRAGEPVSTGRLQDGRFPPGVSGTPAGRLPGTKNRVTKAAEELLEGEAEALTRKAVELALEGDTVALRLCLERLLPPRKSRRVTFDLPTIQTAADLLPALAAVVTAMGSGDLAPDEAAVIAGVLEAKRKAIETGDLERRLAALEERTRK